MRQIIPLLMLFLLLSGCAASQPEETQKISIPAEETTVPTTVPAEPVVPDVPAPDTVAPEIRALVLPSRT